MDSNLCLLLSFFFRCSAEVPNQQLKTKCAFCPEKFEIQHPLDGKFVCGKKRQFEQGLGVKYFTNLLDKPFTSLRSKA